MKLSRVLYFTLLFFLFSFPGPSGISQETQSRGNLVVYIEGFVTEKGVVRVALFNIPDGFPDKSDKAFLRLTSQVQNGKAVVHFDGIPYGTYAVSVYHDINSNQCLDKGPFGIPKEPFCVSNNPKILMGPPSYEESHFEFNEPEKTIHIMLPSKISRLTLEDYPRLGGNSLSNFY